MEELVDHPSTNSSYTVVARRYRPKTFDELIGQDHVSQALSKAIATGRVGHAYLFTGARGVGKTSTARIFAKALSVTSDMPPELIAEISSAIDSGDDMDVIEIDGASNRRIEEIRQLRSDVNMRPGRARFKIYIIDEVHMLTKEAFNALLKTLEEPPEHVKFIFCTTDPDKIPITILSRCQRYDFVPVSFEAIQKRLVEIAQAEGFSIDADAVALLARRAAGSMRDSQSLLEQVMSFCSGTITADQVHAMLGTADESNLQAVVEALRNHNPLAAIAAVDLAIRAGADAGQMTEQLLNYLRDLMAVGIGGGPQTLKFANPAGYEQLKQLSQDLGVQTILSAIQILDEALVRMRASVSAMTLLEVALVQISQLQHLASIPALLESLGPTRAAVTPQKKNLTPKSNQSPELEPQQQSEASSVVPSPHFVRHFGPDRQPHPVLNSANAQAIPVATEESSQSVYGNLSGHSLDDSHNKLLGTPETGTTGQAMSNVEGDSGKLPLENRFEALPNELLQRWSKATQSIEGILSDYCQMVVAVEEASSTVSGLTWRVIFPPGASQARDYCDHAARKSQLIAAVTTLCGQSIQLSFEVQPGQPSSTDATAVSSSADRQKKNRELMEIPLVKKICETLDAEIVKVHSSQQLRSYLNFKKEEFGV